MDESERMAFERQFDDVPTKIGGFELLTSEVISVHIHHGVVDCPIYAPVSEDEDEDDMTEAAFLLRLSPMEARNLAGLLTYAAGRADESSDHCPGCGGSIDEDGEPI